ncbi:hypothetical protein LDFHOB_14120 [Candidatus Electronema aureum]
MSKDGKIFIEADEMWTFVGKRDDTEAAALWKSLSEDCKKNGIFFTDGLTSYGKVFPAERHSVVSKGSGKKSHIERINLTFRQRVSVLIRKTLSFSRSIENLTAYVWRFINHYNDCILFH